MDVINETVGDAISDMLLVETVLHARGWSIEDWNSAYADLPNRQMKVSSVDNLVKLFSRRVIMLQISVMVHYLTLFLYGKDLLIRR